PSGGRQEAPAVLLDEQRGDSVASRDFSTALVCVGKDEDQLHFEREHERTESKPTHTHSVGSPPTSASATGAAHQGTALVLRSTRPKCRSCSGTRSPE